MLVCVYVCIVIKNRTYPVMDQHYFYRTVPNINWNCSCLKQVVLFITGCYVIIPVINIARTKSNWHWNSWLRCVDDDRGPEFFDVRDVCYWI